MVLLYKNYHIHSSLYARSRSRLGKSSQKFGVELHVMVLFGSLKAIDAGEMDGRSANLAVECRHVFLPFHSAGGCLQLIFVQLFHCLFSSHLCLESPALSCTEQTLHHIILRSRAVELHRTILLYDLEDLIPGGIGLLHILPAHSDVG